MSLSPAIGAGAYLALMTLWIYGDLNRGPAESISWIVALIAQIVVGVAVNRWWALALPLVVVAISIPAGMPPITPSNAEPFPIWFSLAFGAVFAIPLVTLGVASRRLAAWRWA